MDSRARRTTSHVCWPLCLWSSLHLLLRLLLLLLLLLPPAMQQLQCLLQQVQHQHFRWEQWLQQPQNRSEAHQDQSSNGATAARLAIFGLLSWGGLEEMVLLIRLCLHLYWVWNLQAKQIVSDGITADEGQVLSTRLGASAPASSVVITVMWSELPSASNSSSTLRSAM